MRNRVLTVIGVCCLLMLAACSKQGEQAATGAKPRATVTMRDGSKVAGAVVSSTATEITLAGDDGITRTIPTEKVQAVEYAQATAPAAPAPPAAPEPKPEETASRVPAPKRELIPKAPPAAAPAEETKRSAPPRPPAANVLVLPAGAELAVRAGETIDSSTAQEGQTYAADVARNVTNASGEVVIPKGADARIVILSASKGGKIRGQSDLVLDLDSVTIGGKRYDVATSDVTKKGKSGIGANKRTAEYTGGGAAIGAVIGAIAGGGRGAAIGAGAGAGAGALTQVLTKGKIKVPVETILTFKLDQPLRVVAR